MRVMSTNSRSSVAYGSFSFIVETFDTSVFVRPVIVDRFVCESMRRRFFRSTKRPKYSRKSAPMMARVTLATMNGHWNFRRSPKSSATFRWPNVSIGVLFAAYNWHRLPSEFVCCNFSSFVAGRIETSAPVSMRYCVLECASVMNKRLVFGTPTSSAAFDEVDGASSFFGDYTGRDIFVLRSHMFDDTSIFRRRHWWCCWRVLALRCVFDL